MQTVINQVQLTGHIGKAPKIIQLENGKVVAKLDVAVNEQFSQPSGKVITKTQWHTITAWGKVARFIQKTLTKGQKVELTGKLTKRSYLDKMGIVRHITEINCHHIQPQRA